MGQERKVLALALMKAENSGYSNLILDHALRENHLEGTAARFVTSCFYGVLERKISIDFVLNRFLKRPVHKATPYTAAVLRSGAYQILFMDKVPASAAVNESVELVRRSREKFNAGLTNAVLRKVAAEDVRRTVLEHPNPGIRYSVNDWIWEALSNDLGGEQAEAFLADSLLPPPVFIRINTKAENALGLVRAELEPLGGTLRETEISDCFLAQGMRGIEGLNTYRQGLFFVQDLSSRLCAAAVDAKPGMRVLDCCAAPGGKSFSVALAMEDQGEVIAGDLHQHRAQLIAEGAQRLGLSSIKPRVLDASVFDPNLGLFDRVLCDVPCSGIGVIRRKPEIKYKSDAECAALPEIQKSILSAAADYVKPGGRLIYSTCTLLKRENEAVVEWFLNRRPEFTTLPAFGDKENGRYTRFPPFDAGDGFFAAVLERK